MLRIWGRSNSVNVQKVLWLCEEIRLPYERRDAGGAFGVVDTPDYLSLNPNGLVPTIEDEGFVLWESNAIVRYLAAKHASGTLWPADPRSRALADQWMDWQVSTLWNALRPLFLGIVRNAPDYREPAVQEKQRRSSVAALSILDAHLQTHAFAAGQAFTVADIALGCTAWRWFGLPIERPALASLQRWFDLLAQRPACAKVVLHPLT